MIWKDTLFIHILNLPFCTFEHFWPLDSAYKSCIIKITINNNNNNKNNNITKQNKTKRYVTKPYRLKLSCNIPSTLLQGFRNYIATILTKLPRRYSVLYQRIGLTVCCSYVSFVCMLFLSCCIVYCCVLLFRFTRCRRHSVCQCLLLGRFFFPVWGFVPPLVCEVLSSFW